MAEQLSPVEFNAENMDLAFDPEARQAHQEEELRKQQVAEDLAVYNHARYEGKDLSEDNLDEANAHFDEQRADAKESTNHGYEDMSVYKLAKRLGEAEFHGDETSKKNINSVLKDKLREMDTEYLGKYKEGLQTEGPIKYKQDPREHRQELRDRLKQLSEREAAKLREAEAKAEAEKAVEAVRVRPPRTGGEAGDDSGEPKAVSVEELRDLALRNTSDTDTNDSHADAQVFLPTNPETVDPSTYDEEREAAAQDAETRELTEIHEDVERVFAEIEEAERQAAEPMSAEEAAEQIAQYMNKFKNKAYVPTPEEHAEMSQLASQVVFDPGSKAGESMHYRIDGGDKLANATMTRAFLDKLHDNNWLLTDDDMEAGNAAFDAENASEVRDARPHRDSERDILTLAEFAKSFSATNPTLKYNDETLMEHYQEYLAKREDLDSHLEDEGRLETVVDPEDAVLGALDKFVASRKQKRTSMASRAKDWRRKKQDGPVQGPLMNDGRFSTSEDALEGPLTEDGRFFTRDVAEAAKANKEDQKSPETSKRAKIRAKLGGAALKGMLGKGAGKLKNRRQRKSNEQPTRSEQPTQEMPRTGRRLAQRQIEDLDLEIPDEDVPEFRSRA